MEKNRNVPEVNFRCNRTSNVPLTSLDGAQGLEVSSFLPSNARKALGNFPHFFRNNQNSLSSRSNSSDLYNQHASATADGWVQRNRPKDWSNAHRLARSRQRRTVTARFEVINGEQLTAHKGEQFWWIVPQGLRTEGESWCAGLAFGCWWWESWR